MEKRTSYDRQADLLKALSNPLRLRIVHGLLRQGGHNVSCIERETGMSQSCVSQHLQKLRSAGILEADRQGNEVFYHVASAEAAAVLAALFREEAEGYVL